MRPLSLAARGGGGLLSPDEASQRSANFLHEEFESRLRHSPVVFRLLLQLAAESDPTDDVTALWPADRALVDLGRLEVTAISPTSAADERRLVFDPTNLTDGITLSADPILLVRSTAYPSRTTSAAKAREWSPRGTAIATCV